MNKFTLDIQPVGFPFAAIVATVFTGTNATGINIKPKGI